jgi:ribosome maturation factor RimP
VVVAKKQTIELMLQPAVESLGYVLWGVEQLKQGRYSVLRIYIDHPEGISVEDCEKVSRQVELVLDVENPINGEYTLEVSSPGMDRPLYHLAQYQQFQGETAEIKLRTAMDGRKNFTGVIQAIEECAVVLEVEGKTFVLQNDNIVKAHLVPQF